MADKRSGVQDAVEGFMQRIKGKINEMAGGRDDRPREGRSRQETQQRGDQD